MDAGDIIGALLLLIFFFGGWLLAKQIVWRSVRVYEKEKKPEEEVKYCDCNSEAIQNGICMNCGLPVKKMKETASNKIVRKAKKYPRRSGELPKTTKDYEMPPVKQPKRKVSVKVSGMDARITIRIVSLELFDGRKLNDEYVFSGMSSKSVLVLPENILINLKVAGMSAKVFIDKTQMHLINEMKITGMDASLEEL